MTASPPRVVASMPAAKKLSGFTFATKRLPEFFKGWSEAELATLGDTKRYGETLLARLEAKGAVVETFRVAEHDKDERRRWDEVSRSAYAEKVDKHTHTEVFFGSREKGLTVAEIATALGIPENMVEVPRSGRWSKDNLDAYMVHAKDETKYHYGPEVVITLRGKDYELVYAERYDAWAQGRAVKSKKEARDLIDWLANEVGWGRVTMDEVRLDDYLYGLYKLDPQKVETAATAWAERRMAIAARDLDEGKFETSVIFLEGGPGAGKTVLLKALVASLLKANPAWTVARLSPGHALDDYMGDEIALFDDCRAGAMSAEDWLLLLDPNNANPASARYKNKPRLAPRVVIISSNRDVLEFFYYARNIGGGDRSEAVDTFIRRIMWRVRVLRPADVGFYNVMLAQPAPLPKPVDVEFGNPGTKTTFLRNDMLGGGGVYYDLPTPRPTLKGLTYGFKDCPAVGPGKVQLWSPVGALWQLLASLDERACEGVIAAMSDDERRACFEAGASYMGEQIANAAKLGRLPAWPEGALELPKSQVVDAATATRKAISGATKRDSDSTAPLGVVPSQCTGGYVFDPNDALD